jgi:SAM-dependent methyltransferase
VNCRACGGGCRKLFSLGKIPLVNNLPATPGEPHEKYPLDVYLCLSCQLGQLKDIVPPRKMFEDYVYYSSMNPPIVESARELSALVTPTLPGDAVVMEIGSNDGYLLQFYKDRGIRVLGIDPAAGPSSIAISKGIPVIQEFFTSRLADTLERADIIHANNVVAHIPDLHDLASGISSILKPSGRAIIEVHYLGALLDDCRFDTVYHEHVYYFSFRSLESLFSRHGLFVDRVELVPAQGGSLRLTLKKQVPYPMSLTENFLPHLGSMEYRIRAIAGGLLNTLLMLQSEGKRVWGFGAAAKATVMMNYCGIASNLIEAIADPTPAKQGKYIPGTGIQIRTPDEWLAARPDHTCLFAWNYAHQMTQPYFTPYAPLEISRCTS